MGRLEFVMLGVAWGACGGSFAAVCLERIPAGRPISGRSHCVCGAAIPLWRNVPLWSWLAQRGRARCCAGSIPRWYFGAELLGAALGALLGLLGPAGLVGVVALTAAVPLTMFARARRTPIRGADWPRGPRAHHEA